MEHAPPTPTSRTLSAWAELVVVYVLLECALWSTRTGVRDRWAAVAALSVLTFVFLDRPSLRRLGLGLPIPAIGAVILLILSLAASVFFIWWVHSFGGEVGTSGVLLDLSHSGGYIVWALVQEFLLQSFFFTRCEGLFGSSGAVWAAATLFAAAHLPNLFLTTFAWAGGLFFCEMFRRYRSIYLVAIIHAALGLTLAVTMPDSLFHHMRAGIGYLQYR